MLRSEEPDSEKLRSEGPDLEVLDSDGADSEVLDSEGPDSEGPDSEGPHLGMPYSKEFHHGFKPILHRFAYQFIWQTPIALNILQRFCLTSTLTGANGTKRLMHRS